MQALLEELTEQLDAVAFPCAWATKKTITHWLAEFSVSPGHVGISLAQLLTLGVTARNHSRKSFGSSVGRSSNWLVGSSRRRGTGERMPDASHLSSPFVAFSRFAVVLVTRGGAQCFSAFCTSNPGRGVAFQSQRSAVTCSAVCICADRCNKTVPKWNQTS